MVKSNGVFDSKFFMCLVLMVSEGGSHAERGCFRFALIRLISKGNNPWTVGGEGNSCLRRHSHPTPPFAL